MRTFIYPLIAAGLSWYGPRSHRRSSDNPPCPLPTWVMCPAVSSRQSPFAFPPANQGIYVRVQSGNVLSLRELPRSSVARKYRETETGRYMSVTRNPGRGYGQRDSVHTVLATADVRQQSNCQKVGKSAGATAGNSMTWYCRKNFV